jgi:hypothetical protein
MFWAGNDHGPTFTYSAFGTWPSSLDDDYRPSLRCVHVSIQTFERQS